MAHFAVPDRATLVAEAAALGVPLAEERAEAVRGWLAELVRWNARMDLTAARTTDELVDLMLADALVLAALVPAGARVIDVGAGAGAPGLALALLRPDADVTLVEPLQKRVSFLRTALGAGRVTNARVVRGKGEDAAAGPERFDLAVARATLAPPEWLALGARLVREGGAVAVLLAREEAPSLEGWAIAEDRAYAWPRTGAARRLVAYRRRAGT